MATGRDGKMNREKRITALNEDLSREYQAIISYVNYSQVLKGAAYVNIADERVVHATGELSHALQIAYHLDYPGGMPSVTPKPVETLREGGRDASIRSWEREGNDPAIPSSHKTGGRT